MDSLSLSVRGKSKAAQDPKPKKVDARTPKSGASKQNLEEGASAGSVEMQATTGLQRTGIVIGSKKRKKDDERSQVPSTTGKQKRYDKGVEKFLDLEPERPATTGIVIAHKKSRKDDERSQEPSTTGNKKRYDKGIVKYFDLEPERPATTGKKRKKDEDDEAMPKKNLNLMGRIKTYSSQVEGDTNKDL
ncbi:hypothetical protein L1987_60037 [Smallanthus sonchifolius]|uniref:Uncharacterized protein n=1 Tax=Smallanthus sonchifolius TaxID=185202 RepID=A0ACB9D703_9ASTR|nr:hypothetical protein L1987_60037 [Smallanthus sonchifolius]